MVNQQTLRALQGTNELIYFQVNCRDYDPADMISRIQNYAGQILKCERKNKTLGLEHYLAMAQSWTFAFANHVDINIQTELWKRFPGVCPYCSLLPCDCKVRRETRAQELQPTRSQPTWARDFQTMLHEIYPANTFSDSAKHLAEEAIELNQAFTFYRGKHEGAMFSDIGEELIDVQSNLFAVASVNKIDLAAAFQEAFQSGCHRCHQLPCKCGFVTDKSPSIR
ncbi:MAG TPA: hypothetical protein VL335_00730 [Candidatus Paceibacterota bacterium]|jgi:NTP pyrophosphatase (non-canonical NTP hydrolase)|nr:hypothetical protein [Candidatus Paceibacterota bacterium]